jgi:hypothetical protein
MRGDHNIPAGDQLPNALKGLAHAVKIHIRGGGDQ